MQYAKKKQFRRKGRKIPSDNWVVYNYNTSTTCIKVLKYKRVNKKISLTRCDVNLFIMIIFKKEFVLIFKVTVQLI